MIWLFWQIKATCQLSKATFLKIRINIQQWNLFSFNNLEIMRVIKIYWNPNSEKIDIFSFSDEDIHEMIGFVPCSSRIWETEEEQHVSRWAGCHRYKKWRKSTIIQNCEKAKELNVISNCVVVPTIVESKHNRYLRLSCVRLLTVRDRKV